MSIIVEQISKVYNEQKALDAISFSIKKGEIVGLLGPNGAGKSTLMKILTTFIKASGGNAKVNGFDSSSDPLKVQQSVGYLPENNPLYLDMYVKEYLHFNALVYKIHRDRIEEVIALTGLQPEMHKKIGQLSKGYRQRVGLANALLHDPEVLILDEPTTGLDPNQLMEIRKLIRTVGNQKTVLLSTHILQEVEAICDRVIIINKGEIVADKTLNELKSFQEQVIEVEFDYRVEQIVLEQIGHVTSVKNVNDFLYELSFSVKKDMRSAVFDFAHDNGLKILKLNQKNASLESMFRELTTN